MENTIAKISLHPKNVEPLTIEETSRATGYAAATILNWHYGRRTAPKGFPPPINNGGILHWRNCDLYIYHKNCEYLPSKIKNPNKSYDDGIILIDPKPVRKRGRPRKIVVSGGGAK